MQTLLPFLLFAFVASITPGPTNILVLANSARHGFVASLPLVLGACAGAAGLVLLVGTGVGDLLVRHATLQTVMSWVGIAWLSWLALRIYFAPAEAIDPATTVAERPRLGPVGAAGLQLVNPKTWMMALAVIGVFGGTGSDQGSQVAILALAFFLVSLPCMSAWAWLGVGAARWCDSAQRMRRFNQAMALLLLASAWLSLLA